MTGRLLIRAALFGWPLLALAAGGSPMHKGKPAMDETKFWKLVEDASRAAPGYDMQAAERQAAALGAALEKLPPGEIVAFQGILDEKRNEAYRWNLWGAADLLNGGCSDDCFDYFRAWLIGRGQKVFEAALRDPDTLAQFAADPRSAGAAEGGLECESFLYVAQAVYRKVAGGEIPHKDLPLLREPVGKAGEEEDLPKLLPRIAKKVFAAP